MLNCCHFKAFLPLHIIYFHIEVKHDEESTPSVYILVVVYIYLEWFLTTNWMIWIRFPAETKDFSSSLCVQTSSEAHQASYPMGIGRFFPPGVKRGRVVTLTTSPIYFRGQE
jgi:hypothetical protein